jgi:hypothetical protein
VLSQLKNGTLDLPQVNFGTNYASSYGSFWFECPRVKQWYRRDEHALQAAEALSAIASLKASFTYPVQSLYHSWLQMFLNADRNTLWGGAGGMVYESETSWDVRDRLEWVEKESAKTLDSAARSLAGNGTSTVLFNFANWDRTTPIQVKLPEGSSFADILCESGDDGMVFCQTSLPSMGIASLAVVPKPPAKPELVELPKTIETDFYSAKVDPETGALISLKTKPSELEVLGGPANVIIGDRHSIWKKGWDPGMASILAPSASS